VRMPNLPSDKKKIKVSWAEGVGNPVL